MQSFKKIVGADFEKIDKVDFRHIHTYIQTYIQTYIRRVSYRTFPCGVVQNKDKIFVDLQAHRVVDRFYVKRCNNCQKFGHYERECEEEQRCGYCCGTHLSKDCQEIQGDNHEQFKCINCKDEGKDPSKHSAMWHKCPTYLERQKKLKKTIPYYQKN